MERNCSSPSTCAYPLYKVLVCNFWQLSNKLVDRSRLAMFIGYTERSKAFKPPYAGKHRVLFSKEVVFDKIAEWFASLEISGGTGSSDN